MENTENVSWLWPFKGGTRKERILAMKYLGVVGLMAVVFYFLYLALAPYF
jgi:inner membrane protein involved in colicin E2 resistance